MLPSISVFNKEISMYAIMVMIGVLSCGIYIIKTCKFRKIEDNKIISLLLISAIGVFFGGHILYALTRIDLIVLFIQKIDKINSLSLLIECLFEIFGGSVFYGGLIGGLLTAYIYMKINDMKINEISDLCAPIIPLFHFFGRIGCFLVGCCYGIESKIGVTYTNSINEFANHVNRFPIQLVEAGCNLILFVILALLYNKRKLEGKLLYLYLITYSILRFILEFFRGDSYRGFIFGMSTSQFISILIILFSVTALFHLKKRKNKI